MRGNDTQVKVHYKGNNDDFIIFVDSAQAVQDWKKDSSIPLAQFASFQIFHTHRHGAQGVLDTAPKGVLEDEFGTAKEDDVVKLILEKGQINESESAPRNGDRNITQGPTIAH